MDGCPLGLGLVVEDKPTEFSCISIYGHVRNMHMINYDDVIIILPCEY